MRSFESALAIDPHSAAAREGEVKAAVASALADRGVAGGLVLDGGFGAWIADANRPVEKLVRHDRLVHVDWLAELLAGWGPEAAPAGHFVCHDSTVDIRQLRRSPVSQLSGRTRTDMQNGPQSNGHGVAAKSGSPTVVMGAGPAGLCSAYVLTKAGAPGHLHQPGLHFKRRLSEGNWSEAIPHVRGLCW